MSLAVVISLPCAALAVFCFIAAGSRAGIQRTAAMLVGSLSIAGIPIITIDQYSRLSIRAKLYEDYFIYKRFPGSNRTYFYSDCASWENLHLRHNSPENAMIKLHMRDGSSILVFYRMIKDGLGQKVGYYDGLPKASNM